MISKINSPASMKASAQHDLGEVSKLSHARHEAMRQPEVDVQLARAYLAAGNIQSFAARVMERASGIRVQSGARSHAGLSNSNLGDLAASSQVLSPFARVSGCSHSVPPARLCQHKPDAGRPFAPVGSRPQAETTRDSVRALAYLDTGLQE